MLAAVATAESDPQPTFEPLDANSLQRLLDGRYAELREQIREVQCRPEFAPAIALPTGEYRERVLDWAQRLASEGLTAPGFPAEFGGQDDPGANVAAFETLGFGDLSLLVKFGFRWREGHITASVAQRFKRGLDEGYDAFEVFRAVQDPAVNAARAHIETVILESFAVAVDGCEDEGIKAALGRLCDLYTLHEIESDKGSFQEHGRRASVRTKAITREVNRLCNDVRFQAAELVDAFGIPDPVLGAPIGVKDPSLAVKG